MDIVGLLRAERDKIGRQLSALNSALAAFGETYGTGRRRMSAAARRRISAAQRARWAKQKSQKVVPIKAGKRHISLEGLANLRAAAKKRWAKVRQQKRAA
jgi:hypothetical protein